MTKAQWTVTGKPAGERELAEALALGRAYRKKVAVAEREAAARDADARAVGRAIRRSLHDQSRRRCTIGCLPPSVSGRRAGRLRLRRFELMAGLTHPARFTGSATRLSFFHFKLTSRGAGGHRRVADRPYRAGEAIRTIRYILRDAAREIEGGGIVSNVSTEPDIVAGLFAALEELELTAGRDNANVYMSLVTSLPHELDSAQRQLVLGEICALLDGYGLPYAGVLHAPDPNGDARNYHAHVVFSWRPFEDRGDGSFAFSDQTWAELNGPAFIKQFRVHAAEAMNEAMAVAGHARRFTPESRATLGDAPSDKRAGKSTPGQKHDARRREDIELAKAEQQLLADRAAVLAQVQDAVHDIVGRAPVDHVARLAEVEDAQARIMAARRAQAVVVSPSTVSVSPPPGSAASMVLKVNDEQSRSTNPADAIGPAAGAVSHEKSVATLETQPRRSPDTPKPTPRPAIDPLKPNNSLIAPQLDSPSDVSSAPARTSTTTVPPRTTTASTPPRKRVDDVAREAALARGNKASASAPPPSTKTLTVTGNGDEAPVSGAAQRQGEAQVATASNSDGRERTLLPPLHAVAPPDAAADAMDQRPASSTSAEPSPGPPWPLDERADRAKQRRRHKSEVEAVAETEQDEREDQRSQEIVQKSGKPDRTGGLVAQASGLDKPANAVTSLKPIEAEQPHPVSKRGVER